MSVYPIGGFSPIEQQQLKGKGLNPASDGDGKSISANDIVAQLTDKNKLLTFRFEDALYTLKQIHIRDPKAAEDLFSEVINNKSINKELKDYLQEFWDVAVFAQGSIQGKKVMLESGVRFEGVSIYHSQRSRQAFQNLKLGFTKREGKVYLNFRNCEVTYIDKKGDAHPQAASQEIWIDPATTVSVSVEQKGNDFDVIVNNTDKTIEKLKLTPTNPYLGNEIQPHLPGTR